LLKEIAHIAFIFISVWFLLIIIGGIIFFHMSMIRHFNTVKRASKSKEKESALNSYLKNPSIIIPLQEAKERWFQKIDKNVFERLTVLTRKKLQLIGYYCKANSPLSAKTVILIHGIKDSSAGMAYLYEEYNILGWNVLSIDLRSHGESDGKKITMGVTEIEDIELWVNTLITLFNAREIYLHGVSMGGAVALMYAGGTKKIPFEVKGLISDCSYARYDRIVRRFLNLFLGNGFLAWSLYVGASFVCFINTGIPYFRMNPEKSLQNIKIPVLLFHGEKDEVVPLSLAEQMIDKARAQGFKVVVVPDAPHIGAYFYLKKEYIENIIAFSL